MTVGEVMRYQPPDQTGLVAWAEKAKAAAYVAAALAPTPFVPASLRSTNRDHDAAIRETTANVSAALLTGEELGLTPMASLRSIDVINGTPALRAIALRALAQKWGHEIWVVESTTERAIVAGRRFGKENEQRSTWTMDRAQKLGIASRDQWKKQPQAMLVARATAEVVRLIASDAILGLPYIAEELGDPLDESPPVTAPTSAKRSYRRASAVPGDESPIAPPEPPTAIPAATRAPEDEPPLGDAPTSPEESTQPTSPILNVNLPGMEAPPDEKMMNTAQRRAVFALLRDHDVKEPDRHAYVADIIGRPIDTFAELTMWEAGKIIDALSVPSPPPGEREPYPVEEPPYPEEDR